MPAKSNQSVDKLKILTSSEAPELVTVIEEAFGADASASINSSVMMAASPVLRYPKSHGARGLLNAISTNKNGCTQAQPNGYKLVVEPGHHGRLIIFHHF